MKDPRVPKEVFGEEDICRNYGVLALLGRVSTDNTTLKIENLCGETRQAAPFKVQSTGRNVASGLTLRIRYGTVKLTGVSSSTAPSMAIFFYNFELSNVDNNFF